MDKEKNKSFKKWLEILQQESWQLELLISGFAIFLLAGAFEQLDFISYQIKLLTTGSSYFGTLYVPFQILLGVWYVLIINLILHVLLRGLWISTIGLRYVSGEIDFKLLNFNSTFDRFLKRRIVSFDLYIQQLEQLCSIVFAFTFLIIFILISFGIYVSGIILQSLLLDYVNEHSSEAWLFLLIPFLLLYLFGGFIYFLDFITLGWIKRRKRISKIYYPFYRFLSFVTLSFIYRPLYYNLIDTKFGRRVVLFLVPYLLIFTMVASITVETQSYLPSNRTGHSILNDRYDDTWNSKEPSTSASINSKYISNGYVELFLPYLGRTDDEVIKLLCPDILPARKGVFLFRNFDVRRARMDAETTVKCHSKRFDIYINDSLISEPVYRFHEHQKRNITGLLTVLDISTLKRGEHHLKIDVLLKQTENDKDTLVMSKGAVQIPFWKE